MISVVIPTYKTQGGLVNSVDSVLKQTYTDVEIIVIDDNDPESIYRKQTEVLMKKYEDNPKVVYIKHKENKNGAAARNTGIAASHGNFIAFLDDDDIFMPEKLDKQLKFLNENIEYQAVYCLIIAKGKIINSYPYEGNCLIPLLKERTRMFTSSLMFRREALLSFGGFNESFSRHQDYNLMIRFFECKYRVGLIKEPLIIYNTLGNNRVSGVQLEKLKVQYLSQFRDVLNDLEQHHHGLRNNIIANNYASVFISHLASREYYRAFVVFFRYFFLSPSGFIGFILNFIKNHIVKYV